MEEKIYEEGCCATVSEPTVANLPSEVSIWSKVKAFLVQDVNREVVITMTPKQEKVLKEVHDFWFQEIDFGKIKDFLFQDISLKAKKD